MWDAEAPGFDDEPDHGLRDPLVRDAWRSLMRSVLPPIPARVADLGCGTGTLSLLLAEDGYAVDGVDFSPEMVRRARRAYFANISYVDEKVGEVLAVLEATRQEAVVVFLSDHGDMLGERGMWFKMNFFDHSARVPLMIAAPGLTPGRCDTPVSTLDLCPTLCDLAGVSMEDIEMLGARL